MRFSARESAARVAFEQWADAHPGNNPERLRGSLNAYAAFSAGFTFGTKAGAEEVRASGAPTHEQLTEVLLETFSEWFQPSLQPGIFIDTPALARVIASLWTHEGEASE